MILGAAWSAVAFLLSFLAVCAVIRLVAYAAHWNSLHPLWRVVDSMLNPVLYRINRIVYRGRIVNYLQGLITGLVVLAVLYFGGAQLVRLAVGLLVRLPV
jgi:YggT family protein